MTLGRLVFFTLGKAAADPRYCAGAPSTVGALIAVCSVILWRGSPALLGLLVGVAAMQMVSFDVAYLHLGRAARRAKPPAYSVPLLVLLVLGTGALGGVRGPVVLVWIAALGYGMWPMFCAWRRMLRHRAELVQPHRCYGGADAQMLADVRRAAAAHRCSL